MLSCWNSIQGCAHYWQVVRRLFKIAWACDALSKKKFRNSQLTRLRAGTSIPTYQFQHQSAVLYSAHCHCAYILNNDLISKTRSTHNLIIYTSFILGWFSHYWSYKDTKCDESYRLALLSGKSCGFYVKISYQVCDFKLLVGWKSIDRLCSSAKHICLC